MTIIAVLAAPIALPGRATTTPLRIGSNEGSIFIAAANERAPAVASAQPSNEADGRIEPRQAFCEEPSRDVATVVSDAVSASLLASVTKARVRHDQRDLADAS